jgi:hypothetical protein
MAGSGTVDEGVGVRVLDVQVDGGFCIRWPVSEKIFAVRVKWVRAGFNVGCQVGIQGGDIPFFQSEFEEGERGSRID